MSRQPRFCVRTCVRVCACVCVCVCVRAHVRASDLTYYGFIMKMLIIM